MIGVIVSDSGTTIPLAVFGRMGFTPASLLLIGWRGGIVGQLFSKLGFMSSDCLFSRAAAKTVVN